MKISDSTPEKIEAPETVTVKNYIVQWLVAEYDPRAAYLQLSPAYAKLIDIPVYTFINTEKPLWLDIYNLLKDKSCSVLIPEIWRTVIVLRTHPAARLNPELKEKLIKEDDYRNQALGFKEIFNDDKGGNEIIKVSFQKAGGIDMKGNKSVSFGRDMFLIIKDLFQKWQPDNLWFTDLSDDLWEMSMAEEENARVLLMFKMRSLLTHSFDGTKSMNDKSAHIVMATILNRAGLFPSREEIIKEGRSRSETMQARRDRAERSKKKYKSTEKIDTIIDNDIFEDKCENNIFTPIDRYLQNDTIKKIKPAFINRLYNNKLDFFSRLIGDTE